MDTSRSGDLELTDKQYWTQQKELEYEIDQNPSQLTERKKDVSGTRDEYGNDGDSLYQQDGTGDKERLLASSRVVSTIPGETVSEPSLRGKRKPPRFFSRGIFLYAVFGAASAVLGYLLGFAVGIASYDCDDGSCSSSKYSGKAQKADRVLILSLDGFRYDYLDKYPQHSYFLNQFRKNSTTPDALISSFPSKTFPNHYSIMTGLYPESHGIIANHFFDPELGEFNMSVTDRGFWIGEPLWVTMAKNNRRSAQIFWPGINVKWDDIWDCDELHPLCQPFDSSVSTMNRSKLLLQVLQNKSYQDVEFLSLYFNEVDHVGHMNCPDSPEVAEAIANLDNATQYLVDDKLHRTPTGLRDLGLWESTDFIIVSDHGMASCSCPAHILHWEDVFPSAGKYNLVEAVELRSPLIGIRPPKEQESEVFESLANDLLKIEDSRIKLFWRENLTFYPFYYSQRDRIPPIVGFLDEGYQLLLPNTTSASCGTHGYDPTIGSMHAIFMGVGPDFQRGRRTEPIQNIHITNIIGSILDIELPPNNGSTEIADMVLCK